MRAHELLRQAREGAGISTDEMAARVGLTEPEYFDVEGHSDEFITVIAVAEARAICKELRLQLADVLAEEPLEVDLSSVRQMGRVTSPRRVLIHQRREALGVSVTELASAMGFEDVAVQELEADERYLDTLPIYVVAEIAWKLELPLMTLLEPD